MDLRSRTVSVIGVGICATWPLLAGVPVRAADLTAGEQARYADLEARPLHSFSNVDLADYLRLRNKVFEGRADRPTPAEEVGHFARKALGQRFRLNANRFDLAESDCVVFVERSIAMACATDWDSYYKICERLRHKNGVVAYKNRNFFTLGDWLPNNCGPDGLLRDITSELTGPNGPVAETFTHVVRPKVFEEFPAAPGSKYTRIVFKGSDYKSPDKEVRTDTYISRRRVLEILPELRSGDVVLVLRQSAGGHLGCDHMGIIHSDDGQCQLVHSAPSVVRVEGLNHFIKTYDFVVGFKFLRIVDSARAISKEQIKASVSSVKVRTPEQMDAPIGH